MDNFIVSVACIIALLIGMVNLLENEMIPKKKKEQFDLLGLLIILEIIIDAAIIHSQEVAFKSEMSFKALRAAEYCISPIIAMLFAKLMTRQTFWKRMKNLFKILIGMNAICQLCMFLLPIITTMDGSIDYNQTPYTNTYIIILVTCIVLLAISANNTMIQNYTRVSYTLVLTAVVLIAGIIVKAIFPKTNADWLCVTFCYLIFMAYICNSYLKIDSLTTLLNRRAFDNKLMTVNYSTALIVIDANNFKSINDNYGHKSGDMALVKISEIIFTVYGKVGFCYRIGGDEFCVILKKGMLQKLTFESQYCDTASVLSDITSRLNEKIRITAVQYPMLKNGVAQGFSIYQSKQDEPSLQQTESIDEVFKLADERMYLNKMKQRHTNFTKDVKV